MFSTKAKSGKGERLGKLAQERGEGLAQKAIIGRAELQGEQLQVLGNVEQLSREKMPSLDQLRNREVRALSKGLEERAALANSNHLEVQAHAIGVSLSSKVEAGKVEQPGKLAQAMGADHALKAAGKMAEQQSKQRQGLDKLIVEEVGKRGRGPVQRRAQ